MMATTVLARLLEATPLPPKDGDVDAVLAAFEDSHARRAAILAEVTDPLDISTPEARELIHHLQTRQDLWREALAQALDRVREHCAGASKLRRYGDGLNFSNL